MFLKLPLQVKAVEEFSLPAHPLNCAQLLPVVLIHPFRPAAKCLWREARSVFINGKASPLSLLGSWQDYGAAGECEAGAHMLDQHYVRGRVTWWIEPSTERQGTGFQSCLCY